jgi:hypothetical protein
MIVKELVENYPKDYRIVVLDINHRDIAFYREYEEIEESVANLEIVDYKEEAELKFAMIRTNIDIKPKRKRRC